MDVFHFPDSNKIQWVFTPNGSTNWQIWQKPANCKFVNILVIGGGGGGGGGSVGAAATNRAGGGGGGASAVAKGFYNANLLPSTLYIQVGNGGLGGASATNGTGGGLSYVAFEPTTTVAASTFLRNGNAGAGFGATIGTGGSAGTAFAQANGVLNYLGLFQATIGTAGTAGSAGGAGVPVVVSLIVTGGASGGGATSVAGLAGGNITGLGAIPTISGGTTITESQGSNGFQTIYPSFNNSITSPILLTGGAGGLGSSAGQGGNGGKGAYGCGGGGGGAGFTGLGGRGGDGGDGIVIITAW